MNNKVSRTIAAALLAGLLSANLHAETPPGYVDFGKFSPPSSGGQFVEVNISDSLIAMVARFGEKKEPELAGLLRGLQGIRVNVIGLNDENRAEIQKRVKSIRANLDSQGWARVVTVQKQDDDVGVYLKTRGDETVQGLVVTVLHGNKQAVLVNIVGDIKPEKVAVIGERFNIEPLKNLGALQKK